MGIECQADFARAGIGLSEAAYQLAKRSVVKGNTGKVGASSALCAPAIQTCTLRQEGAS
jgi:hypothetical protein